MGPECLEIRLKLPAQTLGVDVVGRGEEAALLEQSQDVGTDATAAIEKALQQSRRFGEQEYLSYGVYRFQIRKIHLDDFRPE